MALFSTLMIVCAAASNAVMDRLSTRYDPSVFSRRGGNLEQWLNPQVSWHNKWKNGAPRDGEAFPFSSTALVGLTDAWHFCKTATIFFLLAGLLAPFTLLFQLRWYVWVAIALGLWGLYGIVFESLYSHLLS